VIVRALLLLVLSSATACGASNATSAQNGDSALVATTTASGAPELTKPPSLQPPLAAPTRVLWAIDRTGSTDRPYFFELHYDGTASGFRVVDASGQLVLQLPIAGSGVWGPETCVSALQQQGKTMSATWRSVDDGTYRDFVAHATSYRVEVDTIGHGTITLPLGDTGCRR